MAVCGVVPVAAIVPAFPATNSTHRHYRGTTYNTTIVLLLCYLCVWPLRRRLLTNGDSAHQQHAAAGACPMISYVSSRDVCCCHAKPALINTSLAASRFVVGTGELYAVVEGIPAVIFFV